MATKWRSRAGVDGELTLFNEAEIAARLDARACVAAVEQVFQQLGLGAVQTLAVLSHHAETGAFHIKAAAAGGYYVAKVNSNYSANPGAGLPTIQGVVVLFEMETGRPLALFDSGELTARRTGAATGVAAKYLALEGPVTVTLVGCGRQARSQLEAVAAVREVERVFLCDTDASSAVHLAEAIGSQMKAQAISVGELFAHTRQSDVVITCTPSRRAFLTSDAVRPGCLVAAVGADNPYKQEIAPELLAGSRVIADVLEQCVELGDLHHAIDAGVMSRADVYAELGDVVAGRKPGRSTSSDVIIFDSTGIALQDVAAAVVVYSAAGNQDTPLRVTVDDCGPHSLGIG